MPREQMESSVEGLKPGWSEILPQIGGVLKSMGFDPVLTSAARTREHQMRINPSAPNSYHVIQGGGDAIIDSRARATGFGLLQIDGLVRGGFVSRGCRRKTSAFGRPED